MHSQRLQREKRIFGDEKRPGKRDIGQGSDARTRHHCGHSSALERGGHKVMTVQPLATHRKKKLARRHGTRVDGIAGRDQRARVLDARRRFEHRSGTHCRF